MSELADELLTKLLDENDRTKAGEADFTPAMSRETAAGVIQAALWAFGVRSNSTSGGYAYLSLMDTLGFELSERGWIRKPIDGAA